MSEAGCDKKAVRAEVEALLRQGFLTEETDTSVRVGEPLVVNYPQGGQHSWFVPLSIGTKLVGFAQILPSLVPLRVSSFRRHPQDFASCPEEADWIDADRIKARAAAVARVDEQLSEPILSFDQIPDRIAWKILLTSTSGAPSRILFVAGAVVYESGGARGLGP